MMEIEILRVRYVDDIPAELTEKAIEAGAIRVGSRIGIDVRFKEYNIEGLIDLVLGEIGQQALIKAGQVIPVRDVGSRYYIREDWSRYLDGNNGKTGEENGKAGKEIGEKEVEGESSEDGPAKRPVKEPFPCC